MNILLTNDDGYNAEGILLTKRLLSKYGRVVIVAPSEPMSAKSVALSINIPLKLEEHDKDVYSFSGTPADCVAFALSSLNIDFDLVVSGCNDGPNVSYDSIYSGTIGAGLEAMIFHKKAISLSAMHGHFDVFENAFEMMWEFINSKNLISDEYLLNINFPDSEAIGIQLAREFYRKDEDYFTKTEEGYYAYRYLDDLKDVPKDTDCYLVNHGIISVVPLGRTYFNESLYKKLK